ncbi:MFS transporter [Actinomadura graeca]|uniref:MFS transporter n=1 Tax=Actinomadura graeca TaxID=2750812 RepID=UPI001E49B556|nr:MFS transporter [Actinomadura graeca]
MRSFSRARLQAQAQAQARALARRHRMANAVQQVVATVLQIQERSVTPPPPRRARPVSGTVSPSRDDLYRKTAFRVMPLLLLCHVVSFIDRTNIGIAQVRMEKDLGFSAQVHGLAVGLFLVGFLLFEVPSNMLLARIGARKTLLRIMVTWGVVTIVTSLATSPVLFCGARFLLGAAEAGWTRAGSPQRRSARSSTTSQPTRSTRAAPTGTGACCTRCAIPVSTCWAWSPAARTRSPTRSPSGRR